MIELLLQAERSLEMGSLDQAERLYWQAIDADSRNAIAIVGLAKVARQRGDDRTAIAFGRRALQVDGEDAVAKRLVAELEAAHPEGGHGPAPVAVSDHVPAAVDAADHGPASVAGQPPGGASPAEPARTTDQGPAAGSETARATTPAVDRHPGSDGWPAEDPPIEARRTTRSDVEWPAADLRQVRPPDER